VRRTRSCGYLWRRCGRRSHWTRCVDQITERRVRSFAGRLETPSKGNLRPVLKAVRASSELGSGPLPQPIRLLFRLGCQNSGSCKAELRLHCLGLLLRSRSTTDIRDGGFGNKDLREYCLKPRCALIYYSAHVATKEHGLTIHQTRLACLKGGPFRSLTCQLHREITLISGSLKEAENNEVVRAFPGR